MGKPCVVGAGDIVVDEERRVFEAGGRIVREGDVISIDGATGEVILDAVNTVEPRAPRRGPRAPRPGPTAIAGRPRRARQRRYPRGRPQGARVRRRGHRARPHRAHVLRAGPHPDRARDDHGRRLPTRSGGASTKLLPFQREDFIGIFRAMDGLPVTIRLLDPPLHEFLPPKEYKELVEERSRLDALGINPDRRSGSTSMIGQGASRCARPTRCSATAAAGSGITSPRDLRHAGARHHGGRLHGRRAGRAASSPRS